MTPDIGQAVRVRGMKPGYTEDVRGTVLTVRKDDRADVLLSSTSSDKVRGAIKARGKPWQAKLFRDGPEGCLVLPAVPLGNLHAA